MTRSRRERDVTLNLPQRGDPEYGFRCPKCHAACTMVNTTVVECINPYCDWIIT
jgi:hypothetical protein